MDPKLLEVLTKRAMLLWPEAQHISVDYLLLEPLETSEAWVQALDEDHEPYKLLLVNHRRALDVLDVMLEMLLAKNLRSTLPSVQIGQGPGWYITAPPQTPVQPVVSFSKRTYTTNAVMPVLSPTPRVWQYSIGVKAKK